LYGRELLKSYLGKTGCQINLNRGLGFVEPKLGQNKSKQEPLLYKDTTQTLERQS
jgi:hypothetical protein